MKVTFLGQAGVLFEAGSISWAVDPYLSNSVCDKYGKNFFVEPGHIDALIRKIPDTLAYHFVTHEHLDHLDPETLKILTQKCPNLKFIIPKSCWAVLPEEDKALLRSKVLTLEGVSENWTALPGGLQYRAVPAAHMALERDRHGHSRWVGYLWKFEGTTYYHSGDTNPHPELLQTLMSEKIDFAFLPINERNYFKEEAGVIGNMSCREACEFANRIKVKKWVPIHWDLFKGNRSTKEELDVIIKHEQIASRYEWLNPGESTLSLV